MKKFVAVISILLLLFCHFSALGEEIDLSTMTTDELINLQIKIQDELYTRDRFMNCFLNPGEYVIGEDIASGDYLIHCVDLQRYGACRICTYDKETGKYVIHTASLDVDDLYRAKMNIGEVLYIRDGIVELLQND